MASKLEELTVQWEENGELKVRELEKVVLSTSSGWATIAFLYEERDPAGEGFRPPKIALRRYRKRGDRWAVDTRFVVSSGQQARALADAIGRWFPAGEAPSGGSGSDDE